MRFVQLAAVTRVDGGGHVAGAMRRQVGLLDEIDAAADSLSGGQKRKLSVRGSALGPSPFGALSLWWTVPVSLVRSRQ